MSSRSWPMCNGSSRDGPIETSEAHPYTLRIISKISIRYAVELTTKGKAYVDEMTPEQTDEFRRMGKESPFRNRPVAENLDLFARMKAGEFPDNSLTLRAKIDMSAPNVWLRDPVLYRVRHAMHHRTGDKWRYLSDVRLGAYPERLH